MRFDENRWMGEIAGETIRRLRPDEKKRLAARLASLLDALKPMRSATYGEEPLFPSELEPEPGPGDEDVS